MIRSLSELLTDIAAFLETNAVQLVQIDVEGELVAHLFASLE